VLTNAGVDTLTIDSIVVDRDPGLFPDCLVMFTTRPANPELYDESYSFDALRVYPNGRARIRLPGSRSVEFYGWVLTAAVSMGKARHDASATADSVFGVTLVFHGGVDTDTLVLMGLAATSGCPASRTRVPPGTMVAQPSGRLLDLRGRSARHDLSSSGGGSGVLVAPDGNLRGSVGRRRMEWR